jgi:hypothetical protein
MSAQFTYSLWFMVFGAILLWNGLLAALSIPALAGTGAASGELSSKYFSMT